MTSKASEQNDPQWQPCSAGEVAALVDNLRQQRRRRRRQRVSAAVCGLAVVGLIGLYAVPHPLLVEPVIASISCGEVHDLAQEYVAGRLDRDISARIDEHLQRCEECEHLIIKLRERPTARLIRGSQPQAFEFQQFAVLAPGRRTVW